MKVLEASGLPAAPVYVAKVVDAVWFSDRKKLWEGFGIPSFVSLATRPLLFLII
jgi:hypothetical protein